MSKYKILVIENDKSVLKGICTTLRMEEYEDIQAMDGKEGVEAAINHKPDLILCDIEMPIIDGFGVLEALRQHKDTNLIPLIFLTVRYKPEDIARGLKMGARDYITKPYENKVLLQRVRTQLQIVEQYKELSLKNKKLEEASEQKRFLLERVAHSLRNPLTGITGNISLLKQKVVDASAQKLLETVSQCALKMESMLKEAIKVAIYGQDREMKEVNFTAIIKSAIGGTNRTNAERKKQEVNIHLAEECLVSGDESSLWDVVDNLMSNAIKYSPFQKTIWVTLEKTLDTAILKVKDEGPGFTEPDKKKAFKESSTLSAKPTGGESSIGIGLYLTRELVIMHHGTITLESEPGNGATFIVQLPLIM